MLKRLKLENFKAFESLDLELAPVTVLFGPNSAGKSSALQFLLLLKQTKESANQKQAFALDGPYVNFGTFADIIYRHDESKDISWSVGFHHLPNLKIDQDLDTFNKLSSTNEFSVGACIGSIKQAPATKCIRYSFSGASVTMQRDTKDPSRFLINSDGIEGFGLENNRNTSGRSLAPVRGYAFPDQIRTSYRNADILSDIQFTFEEYLDWMYYVGPLREAPLRHYMWSRIQPLGVGSRGERTIEAILAASHVFTPHPDGSEARIPFQEAIAYWLKEMRLIHSFSVIEIAPGTNIWAAKIKVTQEAPEVFLSDVGFGVSQVLPIIVALYYAPGWSVILMEQPELHLHPRAQTVLAELILSVSKMRELQVIVETHSEHLLLRLQRKIAENSIKRDDVKLYFFSIKDGQSVAEPLRLNDLGEIENWPENFFGDAFGETAAAEEARLKRMMQS